MEARSFLGATIWCSLPADPDNVDLRTCPLPGWNTQPISRVVGTSGLGAHLSRLCAGGVQLSTELRTVVVSGFWQ